MSDLEALMHDTHKFESRYLDVLIAPLDEGGSKLCKERSPIHHVDKLKTALGFFQGDEDKVGEEPIVHSGTGCNIHKYALKYFHQFKSP